MAEWTLVQTGKESNEYIDLATIRVSGNLAKMWTLTNISKNIKNIKAGEKALAVKTVHEYDCKKPQSRLRVDYSLFLGTTTTWGREELTIRLKPLILNGRR